MSDLKETDLTPTSTNTTQTETSERSFSSPHSTDDGSHSTPNEQMDSITLLDDIAVDEESADQIQKEIVFLRHDPSKGPGRTGFRIGHYLTEDDLQKRRRDSPQSDSSSSSSQKREVPMWRAAPQAKRLPRWEKKYHPFLEGIPPNSLTQSFLLPPSQSVSPAHAVSCLAFQLDRFAVCPYPQASMAALTKRCGFRVQQPVEHHSNSYALSPVSRSPLAGALASVTSGHEATSPTVADSADKTDSSVTTALLGLRNSQPSRGRAGRAGGTKRAASGKTKARGQAQTKTSALSRVVACNEGMDAGNDIKRSTVPCNCRKSRCLKLYCECFAADRYCNGCHCQSCMNTPEHYYFRQEARALILSRNPNAFRFRQDSKEAPLLAKGCNCKKNSCLKGYCECFLAGFDCGSKCSCHNCLNHSNHPEQRLARRRTQKKK